jgi:DNA-binding transcriptional regulator YdaS (Cro superfamily)
MYHIMTPEQQERALSEILRAVRLLGSYKALADKLTAHFDDPVTPAGVHKWTLTGVPPKRAVQIETVTNGMVLRQELRPDLYDNLRSVRRDDRT